MRGVGGSRGAAEPLSAQPRAQHLVAQRLGGASRAPLVLHALHAGQAGVGLLHHRDLAGLRVVVGLAPVREVDGVLGAAGEGTAPSAHPGPCRGAAGSVVWLRPLPGCLPAWGSWATSSWHPAVLRHPWPLLLSSRLTPPTLSIPVGSCPPLPLVPQSLPPRSPTGALMFAPQGLQPPDPHDLHPAVCPEVPWQGSIASSRPPPPHTPQHPSAPHSRLAAAHADGVQAGAEQAVGAQPRLPKGELLPLVLTGSCKGNAGHEHMWAGAGACGSLLGTPLPSKRGQRRHRDIPPTPRYRRYLVASLPPYRYGMLRHLSRADAPIHPLLAVPCSSPHCSMGLLLPWRVRMQQPLGFAHLCIPGRRQQRKGGQPSSLCCQSCMLGPSRASARSSSWPSELFLSQSPGELFCGL